MVYLASEGVCGGAGHHGDLPGGRLPLVDHAGEAAAPVEGDAEDLGLAAAVDDLDLVSQHQAEQAEQEQQFHPGLQ